MREFARVMRRALARVPPLERLAIAVYNRWFTAEAVTRQNSPRGYDRLYGSDRLLAQYLDPSRVELYDEVARIVAAYRPQRVVDVGSGAGQFLAALAPRLETAAELVGVEQSRTGIERARGLLPAAEWINGALQEVALEPIYDVVVCMEVLEHVDDAEQALLALMALRAPSGLLILTVPDGAVDSWEGHTNFWTRQELEAWLEPHGLERLESLDEGRLLLAVVAAQPRRHTRSAPVPPA
jgi:2-polyprenyl-3-methyl-5-hydroxy-6-metoxy-1,4-benzoquinol methylase